jgi:hypothetical protein
MDVVTGGRDCPTNFNKHTLQLDHIFEQRDRIDLYKRGTAVEDVKRETMLKAEVCQRVCLVLDPYSLQT